MKVCKAYLLLAGILFINSCSMVHNQTNDSGRDWNDEVIYHVFQRSFYDSNGDRHGDLRGFVEKLDYLKQLGVTAILFTPLYESDFYHNYFAKDYERIDPEFGTMDDYLAFIKAVHQSGLKFIMDMETQYAQNGNKWFDSSYKNPASPFSAFIRYSDPGNLFPDQFMVPPGSGLKECRAWPDLKLDIVYLNLGNPKVREWMKNFYAYWVDPNRDGKIDDGVDGFRIDHMMDNLDNRGFFTDMFAGFWGPVISHCKAINPGLFVVGEQSNWAEYGEEMIQKSGIDASFGFPIHFAIAGTPEFFRGKSADSSLKNTLDANNIAKQVTETLKRIPPGKYYVNFIENHDVDRFASVVKENRGKIRCAAVLNILLPGIPSVYYGQELGVTGQIGNWGYDVNHIPVREAFPWTPDPNTPGTAVFYKDTGPWWDQSYFKTGGSERFALSVQQNDPGSLWNLYRELIAFRRGSDAIKNGNFERLPAGGKDMLAFTRATGGEKVTVMMNLSANPVTMKSIPGREYQFRDNTTIEGDSLVFQPFGYIIFRD
jgi:alpha-amylase